VPVDVPDPSVLKLAVPPPATVVVLPEMEPVVMLTEVPPGGGTIKTLEVCGGSTMAADATTGGGMEKVLAAVEELPVEGAGALGPGELIPEVIELEEIEGALELPLDTLNFEAELEIFELGLLLTATEGVSAMPGELKVGSAVGEPAVVSLDAKFSGITVPVF